ncbi:MAG: outer membrane protein assembly factor BamD [Deltaproteobacteria bacterium]|nr:MAG: outer membrane protein assembly factor BamD [Deltaproteobacteria bacterium]
MQIFRTLQKKQYLLIFVLLLISGCAGAKVKEIPPAEDLYNEAMEEFDQEKGLGIFSTSDPLKLIEKFQKVIDYYPVSKYAVLAELRIADVHFRNREYQEAIICYQEFKRLHPTNEHIPYVQYQLGLCHYKLILSIDRDQRATEKAVSHFEELIRRFPECEYAGDAREKLLSSRRRLAEHEFYVGKFYYRRGDHQIALGRFKRILRDYPGLGYDDKALYFIARCHFQLREWDEAREALQRLSDNYPDSKYRKKAQGLQAELKD